ncbi:gag-pol polyprotein [Tanacetum coccineum]
MESLNSNSQEREMHQLQQMQDKAKEKCMESFRLLHSHLKVFSIKGGFERACVALLNQDNQTFTESLLLNLGNLEKQLDREEFQETEFIEYTRTEIQQFRDTLIQHMKSVKKSIDERAQHKRENNRRVNDRVMQSKEGKVDSSTTLDAGLVVTESNETESERHVSSSRSGKDTHAEDAEINSVNDKQPLAEVQLTVQHDTLANEQQHYVQSEPIYDTHLLEKVDRNTIPDSTNMCHRGGEIEQNAEKCQVSCPLLDPSFDNMTTEFSNQSLESENIFLKKTVAQLQKDFSRMETHCVNMELKYQNQALKDGQHGQILNETSNKAKINKEIEVLEKINIELEHSVAKLLADNEKLHKENEHLKQTYKDLYDSIKTTRVQTKDHNDSLIAQINSKTVENADLKAQIQEKVFANVALKNELRKLKGNSVDTKFAKPSILGKPVLQPPRNQSVVRQPNAFKSERPNFSKPRFASQVDVNNVLSKPVTQHYLPKGRESAFAKPNHMIASSSSRNSSKNMPRFSSNDMVHNYYLEEAKKKTQERDRKSTTSVMPSAKSQNTTKSCKSKPRSNNQTSRVLPTSKSSCPTTTVMPKADHSRNSSPFSDFKHFVCSTCQKCVFNANHDACITKFLKEVNSRAKIQPNKTRNSNKPVDPTSHTQKPGRKIVTGHSFSPNKSSAVHEKTNTPRSYLRWIPTGRIFNTAGLKWVPTGKTFTSSTTKVDCELPNGSNDYITNPYKCDQTLNVSAGTLNLSAGFESTQIKIAGLGKLIDNININRQPHKLSYIVKPLEKKKVMRAFEMFVSGRFTKDDLTAASKDHMIYHICSQSYKVRAYGGEGNLKDGGVRYLFPADSTIGSKPHVSYPTGLHNRHHESSSTCFIGIRNFDPYVYLEVYEVYKVNEFQRSFCHYDTDVFLEVDEVNGMSIVGPRSHKFTQDGNQIYMMAKRLCLVDDLKTAQWFTMSNKSSAIQEKLLTQDKILKWDKEADLKCSLCSECADSHEHLFFKCHYSAKIWEEMKDKGNFQNSQNSLVDIVNIIAAKKLNNNIWVILQKLLVASSVYHVWQERNKRNFQNESRNVDVIIKSIKEDVINKLTSLKVKDSAAVKKVARAWDLKLDNKSLVRLQ